jgi:hypothetical protein
MSEVGSRYGRTKKGAEEEDDNVGDDFTDRIVSVTCGNFDIWLNGGNSDCSLEDIDCPQ